jgi:4-amino-4-deoxy-L-arabinose transferase-like glycosyltransferase
VPALVRLQRNGVSQENSGSLMASPPHRRQVVLWLLLGLAAALRVWKIGDKNLWLDESVSWESATSSVRQLIWSSATDIHPPLYYLLLKPWIWMWGDSLAAMRSLSAIASVVALYLLFRLVDGAMPAGVCYAVVLWCALSPHEVFYAQEIRMYAPVTAATLGVCLAYRRWIESRGERRSALVVYGIATATALSFHYFAALVVGALWLHFVICGGRRVVAGRAWKGWLVANAVVAIGYTPWVIVAAMASKWKAWFAPVSIAELPGYVVTQLRWMLFGYYDVPGWQSWSYLVTLGVLGGGGALLLAAIVREREERDVFFGCVAYVPVIAGLLVVPVVGDITLARYLPYATPLMAAAAALGWTRTQLSPRTVAAIVCIGSLGLLPSLSAYYRAPTKVVDPRPIVAYLMTHVRHAPGEEPDPVFVAPGYLSPLMRYYSRDAIAYHKANSSDVNFVGPDFAGAMQDTWIVVDGVWLSFHDLDRDRRLIPVDVPGSDPNKMRLFRIARD